MRNNRIRNIMRKWIRALIRIRLGLCALLIVAFVATWALIFYSGTPRYDARLETDILGANQLGMDSAAVLTGVTSREEINHHQIQPDFVFDDIQALGQALQEVYS